MAWCGSTWNGHDMELYGVELYGVELYGVELCGVDLYGMTYVRGMGMVWHGSPPSLRNAEAASLMWSTYLLIRLLCGTRGIEREEERLTD